MGLSRSINNNAIFSGVGGSDPGGGDDDSPIRAVELDITMGWNVGSTYTFTPRLLPPLYIPHNWGDRYFSVQMINSDRQILITVTEDVPYTGVYQAGMRIVGDDEVNIPHLFNINIESEMVHEPEIETLPTSYYTYPVTYDISNFIEQFDTSPPDFIPYWEGNPKIDIVHVSGTTYRLMIVDDNLVPNEVIAGSARVGQYLIIPVEVTISDEGVLVGDDDLFLVGDDDGEEVYLIMGDD